VLKVTHGRLPRIDYPGPPFKTAAYTALITDEISFCDTNLVGAFTATLPAASACIAAKRIRLI
jgi:hypothetical protein